MGESDLLAARLQEATDLSLEQDDDGQWKVSLFLKENGEKLIGVFSFCCAALARRFFFTLVPDLARPRILDVIPRFTFELRSYGWHVTP